MRATIVIVNWNGAHLLGACLDAVAKQDVEDFQTWVADNASTDGSLELLARDYPWVRVIQNGANLGFAGGNNAAMRLADTPFTVLLNNDAVPDPSWLRNTLAAFEDAPEVGCVTPKILFLDPYVRVTLATETYVPGPHDPRELGVRIHDVTGKPLWERFAYGDEGGYTWTRPHGELLLPAGRTTFRWAADKEKDVTLSWDGGETTLRVTPELTEVTFWPPADAPRVDVVNNAGGIVLSDGYGADRGFQQVDEGQFDAREEVFTFCGNGVAFRREVLDRVGLFDDDFFLYYEDTDLSWRVRAAGWTIRYEPTAVLRHLHTGTSGGESSPVFRFHVDRNRLLMLTKNATAPLAVREVLRYPLTTLSIVLRAARGGRASLRGAARPTLLRLRVMASYLRLLPVMLTRRRAIDASRTVSRRELERRWLVRRT